MKVALARQASQALARSRLFAQEQALRRRMTFLAEASELLSSSLDYNGTLRKLTQLAVPGLADWCAIDMAGENGEIVRLAVAHQDPEKVRWAYELQERYPPNPSQPHGVPQVLRSGEPEFFPEIPEEVLEQAIGDDQELREIVDQLGLRSTICVPLTARGRTLGALTLIAAETHPPYTEADFELAMELAHRAAVAVDNARLYGEAEKGANAAQALAYVADGVVLLDRERVVRHWNPAAAAITGVDGEHALGQRVDEVVPAWAALTSHVALAQPGSPGPAVTVPLVLDGRELWVAVSGVDFGEGTVYALQDVTGEHALEKTRSDFVATASHELRTPLAAVYGAVRTLRREDVELSEQTEPLPRDDRVGGAPPVAHRRPDPARRPARRRRRRAEGDRVQPRRIAAGVIESASVHLPEGITLELAPTERRRSCATRTSSGRCS